eukprot:scaffold67140_cov53-Attheya_sp.AAC.2
MGAPRDDMHAIVCERSSHLRTKPALWLAPLPKVQGRIVCNMKWKKRTKRVKHIHIPPASSVISIRVKPSQTEKENRTVFVQWALLSIESMRVDYEVSETLSQNKRSQSLEGR